MEAREFHVGMSWNAFWEFYGPMIMLGVRARMLVCITLYYLHQCNRFVSGIHSSFVFIPQRVGEKIQWKLYWGNSWNDRTECGWWNKIVCNCGKLVAFIEVYVQCWSALAQKSTLVTIKIEIPQNYIYETKPQKPQIVANTVKRREVAMSRLWFHVLRIERYQTFDRKTIEVNQTPVLMNSSPNSSHNVHRPQSLW